VGLDLDIEHPEAASESETLWAVNGRHLGGGDGQVQFVQLS
jgi:hypothetical protein